MRVLITGCSGFLGTNLLKSYIANGVDKICVFSRGEHRQAELRVLMKDHPACRWLIGDVRDAKRLERAMQGIDIVIHAAALKRIEVGYQNPDEMVKTNVMGSLNVVDAAAQCGVQKVLLISSDKAYQPVSPYGQSKALAESIFLTANNVHPGGPKYAVVRYGNVWKSTGSVVPLWQSALRPVMTDPECTRFYMTILQAVDFVMNTAETMNGGELAIPTLPAYRLGDLAAAMGINPEITGLPKWEKRHESMSDELCSATARRMPVAELKEILDHG